MQSAWRVIDCTDMEGRLRYDRGRLLVYRDGDANPAEIPLSQTAVILLGLKATCSTALLFELAQYGVSVLLCDWRGVPTAAMHSWSNVPTLVTLRHRAQVGMSVPKQKNAWMRIVRAKIAGQANVLDGAGREGGDLLRSLARSVRSGDPANMEGQAAREYWSRLFSPDEDFHRIPGDGIGRNAQLDYSYAVLRGFVVRSIIMAGLSPPFGIYHRNRSNYFCLADDLIEPFRPAMDAQVAQLGEESSLADKETKRFLVHAANMQFQGSGLTIPSMLDEFAKHFGMYCEGKIETLKVPVFGGGDEEG